MQEQFEVMRDALNKTGRNIVYAIDDWGVSNPWEYGISVSAFHWLPRMTCQSLRQMTKRPLTRHASGESHGARVMSAACLEQTGCMQTD